MRKDVKVGFAIGAVLLAVLIVYVLVVPATDKNGNQVADIGAPAQTTANPKNDSAPAANSAQPIGAIPAQTPKTAPDQKPADPSATSSNDQKPSTPVATATPDHKGDVDWAKLLDGGPMPSLMSQTSGDKKTSSDATTDAGETADRTSATPPDKTSLSAEPTTKPSGERTHTVQPHETLSAISSAAYGNPNHWKEIAAANPKIDPNHLKTGVVLVLPAIAQSNNSKAATPAEHASGSESTVVESTKEYRVKSGDTLHRISVKLYGKADRADKIYELNKDAIGSDPNKLKLNMVLKLPESPSVASR